MKYSQKNWNEYFIFIVKHHLYFSEKKRKTHATRDTHKKWDAGTQKNAQRTKLQKL